MAEETPGAAYFKGIGGGRRIGNAMLESATRNAALKRTQSATNRFISKTFNSTQVDFKHSRPTSARDPTEVHDGAALSNTMHLDNQYAYGGGEITAGYQPPRASKRHDAKW